MNTLLALPDLPAPTSGVGILAVIVILIAAAFDYLRTKNQ